MDKKRLALLEKAFDSEVNAALKGGPRVVQTRSRLAQDMVNEGLLQECSEKFGMATVTGFVLTHAGRLSYCLTCGGEGES
jgi:hypothetical protein